MNLGLDFETKSHLDLKEVGLDNYARSASVLMLAWGFEGEEVELWFPENPIPNKLKDALNDPQVRLIAWNSAFERSIFEHCLKMAIPISRWFDPQASARYLSLPGKLLEVGEILGLPLDQQKHKEGKKLIDIFCEPTIPRKKKGQPEAQPYFRDKHTDPKLWKEFEEYCKQDVRSEFEIMRRLKLLQVFPLPDVERQIWEADQKINARGFPVDRKWVESALILADREKNEAIESQNKLTGLTNANSNSKLLVWCREQGYDRTTLKKEVVESQLQYNEKLTPLCKQVLEARRAAASTSYKKLSAILKQLSPDDRLRNQFIYMGSSRCGRWSGNAVQIQNLARPAKIFKDSKNVERARTLIRNGEYETIQKEFGSVLLTVKSNIRTAFVAQEGYKFGIADLSGIETRVGAWLAQCQSLLDVFLQGHDPYIDFGSKMTQVLYEIIERNLKSDDLNIRSAAEELRQLAKSGVLGAIFRLSGGELVKDKNGDTVKTGLWGYAERMGIKMTREQAHEIVRVFREAYKEIPACWQAAEKAVKEVLAEGTSRVKRSIGPNGAVKIDKLIFKCNEDYRTVLRIQLPSGRFIHYMDASVKETRMPWKSKDELGADIDVYRPSLVYAGTDQLSKQWRGDITSHGGKIFQNCVQGIARDILSEFILRIERETDIKICGHVHDEIIGENLNDAFSVGAEEMKRIMGQNINFVTGLPLAAESFETQFYRK